MTLFVVYGTAGCSGGAAAAVAMSAHEVIWT
jgi:hypothetical protein